LSECAEYPAALADRSLSGRQILDEVTARRDLQLNVWPNRTRFEDAARMVHRCNAVSFKSRSGAVETLEWDWLACPIDTRDVPAADLCCASCAGEVCPSGRSVLGILARASTI